MTARLHSVEEAADLLHVSRAHIFTMISRNEITSVKVGKRRLISERAIGEYIARLEAAPAAPSRRRTPPTRTPGNPFVAAT